jgi:hypothetical protein
MSFTSASAPLVAITPLFLAIAAFAMAYQYKNAQSEMWKKLWFFMTLFFAIISLAAMYVFASDLGVGTIPDVMMALFMALVWIFIISLWLFVFTMYRQIYMTIKEAWHGKKD